MGLKFTGVPEYDLQRINKYLSGGGEESILSLLIPYTIPLNIIFAIIFIFLWSYTQLDKFLDWLIIEQ